MMHHARKTNLAAYLERRGILKERKVPRERYRSREQIRLDELIEILKKAKKRNERKREMDKGEKGMWKERSLTQQEGHGEEEELGQRTPITFPRLRLTVGKSNPNKISKNRSEVSPHVRSRSISLL
ncbi:hypothetical protein TWF506_010612 [Arthrobotrys conoides]|uniref:Uncharacterized protein n=1 Tax=Arthrobotrys conoides TaxID=74498 RepID=A0AAN8NKS5_9PEZI